ncbi:NAD-P-binding protein [Vararia minispora EC-137]|uniref:NAD-P-binding protein n=1 Tax=Vararia minispora EC-137 TaxID=1314806 RepID=A0ACB8QZ36_9AGAM|nr:NAD-P-binding protein [Vararia minispora EC-137]
MTGLLYCRERLDRPHGGNWIRFKLLKSPACKCQLRPHLNSAVMAAFLRRMYKLTDQPLRFGILGAAIVAPLALILPAKTHPDVVVIAIASRDQVRAGNFAKRHGVPRAYGGPEAYQALLEDPDVDVVYNPLPNGLHYEWTMKALVAGKHVLLEKPSAITSDETRRMFALAEKKGLVLMEAFHYRFHPAARRVKAIVDAGKIGKIQYVDASLGVPRIASDDNNGYKLNLGGGCFMDMGCYLLSITRYMTSADPTDVISVNPTTSPKYPGIDIGATAELAFPGGMTASFSTHFRLPPSFCFIPQMPKAFIRLIGTQGELMYNVFPAPHAYHSITITNSEGKIRTEKEYGIEGWSTYRYQLEAFVDRIRGRTPDHWFDGTDSIVNMEWVERVYEASGLGPRPASTYVAPE